MLNTLLKTVALGLGLITVPGWADEPPATLPPTQPSDATPANPLSTADPVVSTAPASAAKTAHPTAAVLAGTDNAAPIPLGLTLSEEVQRSVDAAKAKRVEFLNQQQDLRAAQLSAVRDARARLREDLRQARERLVPMQRESAADTKAQAAILKEELQQHREVIESAKGEVKDRPRPRKDD